MKRIPLLDLGNVILTVDFSPYLEWIENNSETKDKERIRGSLSSSLFFDYEFGNIERREFIARMESLFHGNFPIAEFEQAFCGIFPGLVEGMEESIEALLAKGPVYCLTNTNELHFSYARANYPILNHLTRIFASHEMGRRKPYPGIYREVAKTLEVHPRQLVFFDDVSANVRGAERAGLESHLFQGAKHLMNCLSSSNNPAEETHA